MAQPREGADRCHKFLNHEASPPLNHALKYRPDIDGLRAIAVLAVVLFHLDPRLAPGGYIGVDVFFVISGYLITSIVLREIRADDFSLGRFYERRIRRLLPALFTVAAASFVVAWLFLLPNDFRLHSEAMAATALFVANLFFWKKTDYFSDPVESLPLLHTWSLAVEEQFYIVFPPLLVLICRYRPRWLPWLLAVSLLVSLGLSELALGDRPESSFYLPHYRAWELLTGAILSIGAIPAPTSARVRNILAGTGLALIAGSVFLYDKNTTFPGFSAISPVLGAALAIHAGSGGAAWIGRRLGGKTLVFFGLISYSLYLWHWPLFVFVRYALAPGQSALPLDAGLLVAAIVLATLSWRFVERPFRRGRGRTRRAALFTAASLALAAMSLLALPGELSRGAPGRFPRDILEIAAVAKEEIPFRKPCFGLKPDQVNGEGAVCAIGAGGEPEFLLWGDSYALALAHGVDLAAKELGGAGRFLGRSACPPVLTRNDAHLYRKNCTEFNHAVLRYLQGQPSIKTVVLAGYWTRYLDATLKDSFSRDYVQLLDDLTGKGFRVVVIDQVPRIGWEIPSLMARSRLFGFAMPAMPDRSGHLATVEPFHRLLVAARARDDIPLLDLSIQLCQEGICRADDQGVPLYRDAHHLSAAASAALKDALKPAIRPPAGGQRVWPGPEKSAAAAARHR